MQAHAAGKNYWFQQLGLDDTNVLAAGGLLLRHHLSLLLHKCLLTSNTTGSLIDFCLRTMLVFVAALRSCSAVFCAPAIWSSIVSRGKERRKAKKKENRVADTQLSTSSKLQHFQNLIWV
jgi:hypothetical protein